SPPPPGIRCSLTSTRRTPRVRSVASTAVDRVIAGCAWTMTDSSDASIACARHRGSVGKTDGSGAAGYCSVSQQSESQTGAGSECVWRSSRVCRGLKDYRKIVRVSLSRKVSRITVVDPDRDKIPIDMRAVPAYSYMRDI